MRKKLKIGDKLYRAIPYSSVFEYTVFGIRERENSSQYEIRCESCKDHEKCELLIAYDDYDKLIHIEMINEDKELCRKHRMWHENGKYFFRTNKYDAEEDRALTYLREAEKSVEDKKNALDYAKKYLTQIQDMINLIEVKRKEPKDARE